MFTGLLTQKVRLSEWWRALAMWAANRATCDSLASTRAFSDSTNDHLAINENNKATAKTTLASQHPTNQMNKSFSNNPYFEYYQQMGKGYQALYLFRNRNNYNLELACIGTFLSLFYYFYSSYNNLCNNI